MMDKHDGILPICAGKSTIDVARGPVVWEDYSPGGVSFEEFRVKRSIFLLAVMAVCLLALSTRDAWAADTTAPSPEDLKQLFVDGKYAELLPKLNKALSLKGDAANQYDPTDLWKMKAESLLRTRNGSGAAQAFGEVANRSDKPNDAAVATATAILIKKSSSFKYTPKAHDDKAASKPEPIDIIDPDSRKTAFTALFNDMQARASTEVDAAKAGTSMPAIVQAAKDLTDLRAVEVAATGSDTQTKTMLTDLGSKASGMISDALDKMSARITAINDAADGKTPDTGNGLANLNEATGNTKPKNGQPYKAAPPGLTTANVNELRQIIANTGQLKAMCQSMSQTFGDAAFADDLIKVDTVASAAHKSLQDHGKEPKPKE
jgi:hypothetical protein